MGLAYIDYCQQEFAIGAALSGDERMMAAYHSGDPYLAFAKQIEMVPPTATKDSHTRERDIAKQCILGIQYGMGAKSLSESIGQSEDEARVLIHKYYATYSTFRDWIHDFIKTAQRQGYAKSVNHWRLNVHSQTKERTLANFPMQANGAEILRLACRKAIKQNIKICSPVHDALLIEASLDDLKLVIARTQQVMAEASKDILNGFEIRTDVMVVHHPNHYESQKGARMWELIQTALNESCDENASNHDALDLMSYLENI